MRFISNIALACAALVAASGAFAQKAGDDIISAGIASINPNASLGKMTSDYPTFQGALTGATANIDSTTTVSMGWLHMYTDNIGAELTIGVPPKLTVDLNTPATSATHPGAATSKALTPTAIAKYFFNTPADKVRPYLGLGVTHVSFQSITANTADVTVNAMAGTSATLSSSWAPVYNAGVIYNLDDKWSINGSVAYMPVTTTATFVGSGKTTYGDLKLNPTDYVIRLGYKF
jgi:outer membrane protein